MGSVITLPFVVVMEALSRIMSATVDKGIVDGFTVGSRNAAGMVVSNFGIWDVFFFF